MGYHFNLYGKLKKNYVTYIFTHASCYFCLLETVSGTFVEYFYRIKVLSDKIKINIKYYN